MSLAFEANRQINNSADIVGILFFYHLDDSHPSILFEIGATTMWPLLAHSIFLLAVRHKCRSSPTSSSLIFIVLELAHFKLIQHPQPQR